MVGAILFTLVPTAIAYLLLLRTRLIGDGLLRLAFAWFLGQFFATWIVFGLAVALAGFTDRVLIKASIIAVVLLVVALLALARRGVWRRALDALRRLRPGALLAPGFVLVVCCLAFAILLFRPHLAYSNNLIYRSEVYWDFAIHYPMIQTFVHGDNFPPENESYGGVPMTYHFFFDLLMAIYAGFGLDIVGAMQFVSVMTLGAMLVAVIGLTAELFGSRSIGVLAALLCITTGSLRFTDAVDEWDNLLNVVPQMVNNSMHPYRFSFVPGNPFGYNGNMWNAFYWIAERQVIMGTLILLFSVWVFCVIERVPRWAALGLGLMMGLFLQWHLYVTIMVLAGAGWVALFRPAARRPLLFLLVGFVPLTLGQVVYLKSLLNDTWFLPAIHDYPRLNVEFATMGDRYPFSPVNALGYWVYGYGLKLVFIVLAMVLLWREHRPAFFVFTGILVPTFILINTVQLSPLSVYDNHKWLKPMNVVMDVAIAYAVVRLLFRRGLLLATAGGIPVVLVLTLSGFMELMPFLNSRPTLVYAEYPSPAITTIRERSDPKATILSPESKELHLAGRKVYLGNSHDEPGATSVLETEKFNVAARNEVADQIYGSNDIRRFCALVVGHGIDVVEFNEEARTTRPLFWALSSFPRFEIVSEQGAQLVFVDARRGCRRLPGP